MGLPGSQRIVQELVDTHYQALYRYAYRLSGSVADAEDLVQEAFCKAQMKFSQLREPAKATVWLFRILRNSYLHRVRERKHRPVVSLNGVAEPAQPHVDSLPDVEPETLQQALNDLPEMFRTPIILYYFEDFSYQTIAEQMDLPLGTVMSRLSRAKAHLRDRLSSQKPEAMIAQRRS